MADRSKEGILKLAERVCEQQSVEQIRLDERKRHAARTSELLEASPYASVEASNPNALRGVAAGPEIDPCRTNSEPSPASLSASGPKRHTDT
jgi:hypothetical protein